MKKLTKAQKATLLPILQPVIDYAQKWIEAADALLIHTSLEHKFLLVHTATETEPARVFGEWRQLGTGKLTRGWQSEVLVGSDLRGAELLIEGQVRRLGDGNELIPVKTWLTRRISEETAKLAEYRAMLA